MLANINVSGSTPPNAQLPDTQTDKGTSSTAVNHAELRPGSQSQYSVAAQEIDSAEPISAYHAKVLHLLHGAVETHAPAAEISALLKVNPNFVYDVDEEGNTALHIAAADKDVDFRVLDILIAAGGMRLLTATNGHEMTAFDVANAANNDIVILSLGAAMRDMLKEQAWSRDPKGRHWRRLNEKCSSLSLVQFQELVSLVGGPNQSDGRGVTPLITVASTSRIDLASWLLSQGANVNDKSRWLGPGQTALLAAVVAGQRSMVQLLLQYGANLSIPVATGSPSGRDFTILDTAAGGPDVAILQDILGPASARLWTTEQIECALSTAAGRGRFDNIRILLDRAADVPLPTLTYVALKAAFAGANDILMLLLARAVDVNAYSQEDPSGRTLTDMAIEGGQSETVALLMSKGGLPREALDYIEKVLREEALRQAAEPPRRNSACVLL